MQDVSVAVVQMVSGREPAQNLAAAARLIGEAATAGARLVVLPENFAVFSAADVQALAEEIGDPAAPFQAFLAQQSRRHGLWLVGGSIPVRSGRDDADPRVYSSCLVFAPDGTLAARYDKLHLFDVDVGDAQGRYRESERFRPGDAVVVVDTPFARVGLAICYDLRFPELFRAMIDRGAEIIVLPSAFTRVTGEAHWDVLVRARAIENSCFLLAAGQGGRHDERRETFGHSMIVDPWGRVLAGIDTGEGVAAVRLEAGCLADVRARLPSLAHRRLRCDTTPAPSPAGAAAPATPHSDEV